MPDDPIEIKIDNNEVTAKLLELAKLGENLRPLMKNIAGIFASAVEDNFKEGGRPDKWKEWSKQTIKQRIKKHKYPGQILQLEGKLAASINTQYDDNSAIIGSNLDYAAIHQLGGKAGKNKKVEIPARPYLKLIDDDFKEILNATQNFLS